jgi:hypothetical protein
MSGSITLHYADVFIAAGDDQTSALVALQILAGAAHEYDTPVVDGIPAGQERRVLEARSLAEALRIWRWEPQTDAQGNIVSLVPLYRELVATDLWDVLFDTLAPYVLQGSVIEVEYEKRGGVGIWRWIFAGREANRYYPYASPGSRWPTYGVSLGNTAVWRQDPRAFPRLLNVRALRSQWM